jgi:O-Antigen ligase
MSDATLSSGGKARPLHVSRAGFQNAMLWLLGLSGCVVFIEPAPFEVVFALVAIVFAATGLRISILLVPLIALLLLYNLGGAFSLIDVAHDGKAVMFVAISFYMAVMAVVVAAIMSESPQARLDALKRGWALGAVIASIAGIMGYFNVLGTFDLFTRYGRAMGPFKDPNVFGTFLVAPAVFLTMDFLLGRHRRPVIALMMLVIILAGVFFSFSRGAWAVTFGSVALATILTFITTRSAPLRLRIILLAIAGVIGLVLLLSIALQFEKISEIFEQRASLDQSYDQGETGRFGNQRRAIPLLLEQPNGFGPLVFGQIFPEDPHNVYLNAFAAYGWLGGVTYAAMILCTLIVGWRLVFQRTPWQQDSIAVWSALFMLILQGFQIDTDHWRHWYLLLGISWGLVVASAWHVHRAKTGR